MWNSPHNRCGKNCCDFVVAWKFYHVDLIISKFQLLEELFYHVDLNILAVPLFQGLAMLQPPGLIINKPSMDGCFFLLQFSIFFWDVVVLSIGMVTGFDEWITRQRRMYRCSASSGMDGWVGMDLSLGGGVKYRRSPFGVLNDFSLTRFNWI